MVMTGKRITNKRVQKIGLLPKIKTGLEKEYKQIYH